MLTHTLLTTSPLRGIASLRLGHFPPQGTQGPHHDDFFESAGTMWWYSSWQSADGSGWFGQNTPLHRLAVANTGALGDIIPAIAPKVAFVEKGTSPTAQMIFRKKRKEAPPRPNLHGDIAPMTMAIGHLMLSGFLTPKDARGVSTARRSRARIIYAPGARKEKLGNTSIIVHTDNLAARLTRLADLDDMFALVRGVGLHALLAHESG